MQRASSHVPFFLAFLPLLACSSSSGTPPADGGPDTGTADAGDSGKIDSGHPHADAGEAGSDSGACPSGGTPATPAKTASNIRHVVVIVQENHSFDSYFAHYCTAPTGSRPTCSTGPSCCEAAPATDPGTGDAPTVLDDAQNGTFDPNHAQVCELTEMDDGKMDKYITGGPMCGYPGNFAYAGSTPAEPYWEFAKENALADNYFQSIAGQSSSNDMYLAHAGYVFTDNAHEPDAIGYKCEFASPMSYTGTTIADLLVEAKVPWAWYGEGYDAMLAAQKTGACPADPMCGNGKIHFYPCVYDPGDDPFAYYKQFADNPKYMFDYTRLACDVAGGTLPGVSFVKGLGYHSEHPGVGTTITAGIEFVTGVVDTIEKSAYAKDTLILVTWDESGGFFDHVAPPPLNTVDNQPYGPRIPFLAIGAFAKKDHISHVQMEHASIVKFIEWNWLGEKTGQIGQRDTAVNNIGDMLDTTKTGATVPAD